MAKTKAKRSVRKKQSAHSKKVTGNRLQGTAEKASGHRQQQNEKPTQRPDRRFVQFRETTGKTVEAVELLTAPDYHTISINFQDKTCLHFSIETGFTVRTDYSDWKTGEQRVLRKWPLIRSSQQSAISDQQKAKNKLAADER